MLPAKRKKFSGFVLAYIAWILAWYTLMCRLAMEYTGREITHMPTNSTKSGAFVSHLDESCHTLGMLESFHAALHGTLLACTCPQTLRNQVMHGWVLSQSWLVPRHTLRGTRSRTRSNAEYDKTKLSQKFLSLTYNVWKSLSEYLKILNVLKKKIVSQNTKIVRFCQSSMRETLNIRLAAYINESGHSYGWITPHIWMSYVTHMHYSLFTYRWVIHFAPLFLPMLESPHLHRTTPWMRVCLCLSQMLIYECACPCLF